MSKRDEINKRLADLLKKADTNVEKLLADYEKLLKQNYSTALKEIKSRLAELMEKLGDRYQYADVAKYNRLLKLEKDIAEEIKKLTGENIKLTRNNLKEFMTESYYRSAYAIESGIGVELGFGVLNTEVVQAALLNPLDRIKWPERMKDNARLFVKQIRSEMTQGFIKGENYAKIARTITERTGIDFNKSMRIARTEGHRVQNAGRLVAYDRTEKAAERLGVKTNRIWLHAIGVKQPRPDHLQMNGKVADDDGLFTLPSGVRTEGPGLSGIAEEDINCQCTTITQVEGLENNFLKRIGEINTEEFSYQEWKDKKGFS